MRATVCSMTIDGLAVVRLEREHGNAVNRLLVQELTAAFANLEADREIRGALLTSSGKIFCPGLDLVEVSAYDRPTMAELMDRLRDLFLRLFTFPKPLVAGIPGAALAGGCLLALTADWRILRRGASIGLNEIRAGVALPFFATQILQAAVSPGRHEEAALLGRNYSNAEAVAVGLAHEIRDGEDLEAQSLARLEEFASKDPVAFARTKQYLRSTAVERIRTESAEHAREFLDSWFSEGARRRVRELVQGFGRE